MSRRGRRTGAGVVALVAGALLAPLPAAGPVPAAGQVAAEEQAAAIVRPAVLVVEVRWHGWVRDPRTGEVFGGATGYRFTSSCTGFAVHADGHLVTAGHCVDPGPEGVGEALSGLVIAELAEAGRVLDQDRAMRELAEHAVVEGATNGSPVRREVYVHRGATVDGQSRRDTLPAEVVDVAPVSAGDVAVLKVERGRLSALELAGGDDAPVGTPVLAVGYPGSADRISDPTLEPSVKDGLVSNRRTVDGVPFYEVSAAATGGMSGGPVVDHAGRVLGLVSHGPAGEPQAFNFAAAASSIRTVLDRNQVPHQLGPIDRNLRAGLQHYYAGDHPAAREYFDAVLAASPTHQQAAEFRAQTGSGGGPAPAAGLDPLLWWAIAAAGVAAACGVAAMTGWLLRLSAPAGHRVDLGRQTP
jgi:S1-C subfamily serine protease